MRRTIAAVLAAIGILCITAHPADAVIAPDHWTRSTIYVQLMTPTDSWADETAAMVQSLAVLGTSGQIHWVVINGACRTGYPCIHVWDGYWTQAADYGDTYYADDCFVNGLCNWNGSTAERADHTAPTWTTIKLNKSYPSTVGEVRALGCHELGHAVADWQHNNAEHTCMNTPIGSYTVDDYSASEIAEARAAFVNTPRLVRRPAGIHLARSTR